MFQCNVKIHVYRPGAGADNTQGLNLFHKYNIFYLFAYSKQVFSV